MSRTRPVPWSISGSQHLQELFAMNRNWRGDRAAARQRGVALITSLLLLLVITIVAVGMFHSFGTQEKLAGNVREKERALHAAMSAQQYAEWWLTQPANLAAGDVVCAAGVLDANSNRGQICSNQLVRDLGLNVTQVPWSISGVGIGVSYLPTSMCIAGGSCTNGIGVGDPPYYAIPTFYIADLGTAADGLGEAYQVDAFGYGGSANAVAVVESTFEVQQGTTCRSCSQ